MTLRGDGTIQRHSNREPLRTLPNDLEAPTGAKRWWNHWPECVQCLWEGWVGVRGAGSNQTATGCWGEYFGVDRRLATRGARTVCGRETCQIFQQRKMKV